MNETAIKWYKELEFPSEFDEEFYELVKRCDVSEVDNDNVVKCLEAKKDIGFSLVYFLTRLPYMQEQYKKRNIPDEYFKINSKCLVSEAKACKESEGKIGVKVTGWINMIINSCMIYRIGRLNFGFEPAGTWCDGGDIKVGDKIVAVHIPGGEKFDVEDCIQSLDEAEKFVMNYFPEFDFKCFMCHSWMMYVNLGDFLNENSNVMKFKNLFTPYRTEEDDSILSFVFGRGVTRENIADFEAKTSLQKKVKAHVLNGGKLYISCAKRERKFK